MIEVANAVGHAVARAAGYRSRYVDTPHGNMHVLDYEDARLRDAPTLLVLHGIGAGTAGYALVLRRLRGQFKRVIMPDLPGHGRSAIPHDGLTPHTLQAAALALFDAVVDEPAVVFGNSLGGLAALRIAQARPDHVRGLLLSSPGGAQQRTDEIQAFLNRFRAEDTSAAKDFVRRLYAAPPWYSGLFAPGVRRLFGQAHMRAFMDAIEEQHLLRPDDVRAIKHPVRLVWGAADTLMLPEHRAFWVNNLPSHAELAEPGTFGHCPYLDQPKELADEMIAFGNRFR